VTIVAAFERYAKLLLKLREPRETDYQGRVCQCVSDPDDGRTEGKIM
jgi:hypothetical protein